MDSSTTNSPLEVVDRVHKISTLRMPHYMVMAFIGTSPRSMRATKIILDTESKYNITCRSASSLSWQRHACPEYEIPPLVDAKGNFEQISPAIMLRIRFKSAV